VLLLFQGHRRSFRPRPRQRQTFRTMLDADGIQATLESPGGGDAAFTSRVVVNADGTFDETGTITYGSLGTVEFRPW
jgi:hypothetical protein